MAKRRLRLILLGLLCITFLLPLAPQTPPICLFSLWYTMEMLVGIVNTITYGYKLTISDLIMGAGQLSYLLAIPALIFLNLCLCLSSRSATKLERLYRISLLVLLPLVWYEMFIIEPDQEIEYWVSPVAVTVATLIEIGFVINERRKKPADLDL